MNGDDGPEAGTKGRARAAMKKPANEEQRTFEWTHEEIALLSNWSVRAHASQAAYFARASTFLILNYVVGIPVVVVTTVVGTSIFSHQSTSHQARVPLLVGVVSVAAAVLASLQTFLRLGEKGAFNAVAGYAYSAI